MYHKIKYKNKLLIYIKYNHEWSYCFPIYDYFNMKLKILMISVCWQRDKGKQKKFLGTEGV